MYISAEEGFVLTAKVSYAEYSKINTEKYAIC